MVGFDRSLMRSHAVSAICHLALLVLVMTTPQIDGFTSEPRLLRGTGAGLVLREARTPGNGTRWVQPTVSLGATLALPKLTTTIPEAHAGHHSPVEGPTRSPGAPRADKEAEGADTFVADVGALLGGLADGGTGPDTRTLLASFDDPADRAPTPSPLELSRPDGCLRVWELQKLGELLTVPERCRGKTANIDTRGGAYGRGVGQLAGRRGTVIVCRLQVRSVVVGGQYKQIFERVIRRHEPELKFCYESALQRQGREFSAEVNVSFAVGPTGGPAKVELSSDSQVSAFDKCVRDRAEQWRFPKTGERFRVNYPFRFSVM